VGKTYEIIEPSALEWIASRLNILEQNGEIEKQQAVLQQKALALMERPQKVAGLQKTKTARRFEHDLTVTVLHDIRDQDGNMIHAAGKRINPLTYFMTRRSLLFLDGEDSKQVAWALQEKKERKDFAKLVLVNGSVSKLSDVNRVRVYFDQAGILVKKFGIQQVPAIVEQQGDKLIIFEVKA
jgi:conjugal transfer pilus assembly protein TraW